MPSTDKYLIGEYSFDTTSGNLKKDGKTKRLSPRAADVLILLASTPGQVVTREQVHESVWAGRIVTDAQVSKAINELRAALGDTTEPRKYIETLPKRGYCLVCTVIPHADSAPVADKNPDNYQKYAGMALVLTLFMAIGYWLLNNTTPESVSPATEIEPGIAVLPFTNLSGNPENEYFSQGIAEELLTRLSRLKGLRVISRTSSFQFRGRQIDVREIGEILSVSHVLEGSVQRSNERVRINIRLIETATGTEVSALQYDRGLADIFELQTEIARAVSNSIQPTLLTLNADALNGYGTNSVEAYEAYLKGRFLLTKRLRGDMEQAASAFREAIEHDPDYLLAHSGLIDTYALLVLYGYVPIPEMLKATEDSYKQLESSGTEFAEVLTSLGITNRFQGKKQRTIDYYERAIGANAQYAQSYLWLADLYLTGEPRNPETALSLVESALRIDPLSTVALMVLSRAQIETGAFKAARKTTKRLLELEPQSRLGLVSLANHYRWVEGDLVTAARLFYQLWNNEQVPQTAVPLGQIFLDMGEYALAKTWHNEVAKFIPGLGSFLESQWYVAQGMEAEIIAMGNAPDAYKNVAVVNVLAKILEGDLRQARILAQPEYLPVKIIGGQPQNPQQAETLLIRAWIAKQLGHDDELAIIIQQVTKYLNNKKILGQGHIGAKMGRVYILMDQHEKAISFMRSAFEAGQRNGLYVRTSPIYAPLRKYPEYQQLEKDIAQFFAQQREWLKEYPPMLP